MTGRSTRWGGVGVVAAVALTTTIVVDPTAGAAAARTPDRGPTVTLLTGDTVTLVGRGVASVRPGPGRDNVRFVQQIDARGDVNVIPSDAAALVSSGRLDRRLFNVTDLVETGYDDASRPGTPLIVDYAGTSTRSASVGTRVVRDLRSLGATAVVADKSTAFWTAVVGPAARALSGGIERIWLDGPVRASLDRSVPQIGAPAAWQVGHTGANTTVAVLDTGIDATHPDLADAVAGAQDFTGSPSGTEDRLGHGTHVASIITGSGERYRGVAPDARLLNGKVLGDDGSGLESWIIAGMEWAARRGADLVNMSLGGGPSDGTDPMSQAVNSITEQTGTLFVIVAGNSGPAPETVSTPGAADAALTVGAVDAQDGLAEFSSRGPRLGDGGIKPEITAPGVGIVAAKAKDAQKIGEPVGEGYLRLSGTSMATPHVAGAAAIIAGQHPDWRAEQLKAALMGSAAPNPSLSVYQQGAGRVDLARAIGQPLFTSPASLSQGVARWPHDDDTPITSMLTYHNTGTEPVTLELAVEVRDTDGNSAPAGMFTVEPRQVTVPAGGQATATATTNTAIDAADGVYGGVVTATGTRTALRTPIGVTREAESYDLTLSFLDRNGNPTELYDWLLLDVDRPRTYQPAGRSTVRLPKGRYFLRAGVVEPDGDVRRFATALEPELVVSADTAFVFDARDAVAPGFTVAKPTARPGRVRLYAMRMTSGGKQELRIDGADLDDIRVRPSATSAPGAFRFIADAHLAEPDGHESFAGSPYLYHVGLTDDARVPADLHRHFTDRDLATVRSVHAATAPGQIGTRDRILSAPLPFTLTEYYAPGRPWCEIGDPCGLLEVSNADGSPMSYGETTTPRTYQRGRTTVERWNAAVFGPAFPVLPDNKGLPYPISWVDRYGDLLCANLPLFVDQSPDRVGNAEVDSRVNALYRDGQPVEGHPAQGCREGGFDLPREEASYRLHTEAVRGGSAELSTRVSADWSFRSEHVDGPAPKPSPLLAVRFAPALDEHNRAPAGRPLLIPVYVQRNGSGSPGRVNTPSVQVSYDDGQVWRPVRLVKTGDRWLAIVSHLAGAKFVSLKASASDPDGNAVDETIIRAYGLR